MSIVLLHPIGLDATVWPTSLAGRAGARCHELPGHGLRADEPVPGTIDDLAADLFASVDLSDGTSTLVGVSAGGMLALHAILARPTAVRSAVIACSAAQFDPQLMEARARAVREHGAAQQLDETLRRWFTAGALAPPRPRCVDDAAGRLRRMSSTALADTWLLLAQHDVRGRLPEITVPITVVVGRDDAADGVAAGQSLAEQLPNARLVEIPGSHMAPLEDPSAFEDVISEHLAWATRA